MRREVPCLGKVAVLAPDLGPEPVRKGGEVAAGGLAGACRPIELRRTAPQVQTLPSVPRLPMAEAGTPTNGIAACSAGCETAPAQGPGAALPFWRVNSA